MLLQTATEVQEHREMTDQDLQKRMDELENRVKGLNELTRDLAHCDFYVAGFTLGAALAVVLSWSRNGSILWAVLHGVCSWGYVLYVAVERF
jgi:hypothetical protein